MENGKKVSAEQRAIQIFNEQINRLNSTHFDSMERRKEEAKNRAFIYVFDLKILLHESSELDKIPFHCFKNTSLYLTEVYKIIEKF